MNRVVAVTGITPNCRKDPVASGSVRVAFRLSVLGFRSAARVLGLSGSVKLGALINVLPVTLYFACTCVTADAAPGIAISSPLAASVAALLTAICLTRL